MTTNFKPGGERKTPIPPDNYVRFRKHFKSLGDGSVMVCPNCSMPKNEGDRWGYCWDGSGYADPQVQATYEQYVASGEWRRAYMENRVGALLAPDGTPQLHHWSRYYTGYCMVCGCRLWEHFGGSMVYPDGTSLMFYRDYPGDSGEIFFLPQTGQLSLFSLFNATLNIAEGLLHA